MVAWGRFKRRLAAADALIYEEIERRRREPEVEERSDVLSVLLGARDEDGEPMTDVELRDELMTMLAAGHETTATGLAWAFDLLLHNPAPLGAPARRARGRRRRLPRRGGDRDAAAAAGDRRGRADAEGAAHDRRLGPAGRDPGVSGDRDRPPARGPVSERARVPAGAVPRRGREVLHVAAVRRRDPALHRRRARPGGDGRGAAGGPRSAWSSSRSARAPIRSCWAGSRWRRRTACGCG